MDASIYRLRDADVLTLCVLGLLGLGVLMVQSASMGVTGGGGGVDWGPTGRAATHAAYAGLALAVYAVAGRVRVDVLAGGGSPGRVPWRVPAAWAMVVAITLCAAVLVPGVGREVNGARRWLPLGPVQVQPSELAKWATVAFLAWVLTARPVDLGRFAKGFLPVCGVVGLACLLVVIEDFGTAALIGAASLAMMVVGGVRAWHLLATVPPALAVAGGFVLSTPYRVRRMTAFLDPWADPAGDGYHMVQSLLSFASGGLTGRGLGAGVQKLGYLPEDTTDFIFAVVCEELGLPGAALVVGLYLGVLWAAWRAASRAATPFARLLGFGVGATVGLQATINLAVATVSVPTKGLSLPLVSAGGSGLVVTCAMLGLLRSCLREVGRGKSEVGTADPDPSDVDAPTVALA